MDKYISIHAKVNSSYTTGKVLISNNNKIRWISGFASTEAGANEKFDKLTGRTLKVLREFNN